MNNKRKNRKKSYSNKLQLVINRKDGLALIEVRSQSHHKLTAELIMIH